MTPEQMAQLVTAEEQRRGLPAGSLQNIFMRESGGGHTLRHGEAGEYGPMQVMASTGRAYGYTPQQLDDPATNIRAGADVFDHAFRRFHGDLSAATAAYNAGEGGARRYSQTHNIADLPNVTQAYMQRSQSGSPNLPWYHATGEAPRPDPQSLAGQLEIPHTEAPHDNRMDMVGDMMQRNYEASLHQQQPYNAPQQHPAAINTGAANGGSATDGSWGSLGKDAIWPGGVQPPAEKPTLQWPSFTGIKSQFFPHDPAPTGEDWSRYLRSSVSSPVGERPANPDDRDGGFF